MGGGGEGCWRGKEWLGTARRGARTDKASRKSPFNFVVIVAQQEASLSGWATLPP